MKIAVVYPGAALRGMDRLPAWSLTDGLVRALREAGHEIEDLHRWRPRSEPRLSLNTLNAQDLVIFSGPEYLFVGEIEDGEQLLRAVKAPKAGLYWDAMLRPDKSHPFARMVSWFDHNFFSTSQDAQGLQPRARGRCHWLEYGVDTGVFMQRHCKECKGTGKRKSVLAIGLTELVPCEACHGTSLDDSSRDIAIGFIGALNGRRGAFHQRLQGEWSVPATFQAGAVWVHDIDGVNFRATAERVALNLNRLLMFLNLPAESEYVPPDVYEAMACGCCVLTPQLRGLAQGNLSQVRNGAVIYPDDPKALNHLLMGLLEDPARCRATGFKAATQIADKHTLKGMIEKILEKFTNSKAEEREKEVTV